MDNLDKYSFNDALLRFAGISTIVFLEIFVLPAYTSSPVYRAAAEFLIGKNQVLISFYMIFSLVFGILLFRKGDRSSLSVENRITPLLVHLLLFGIFLAYAQYLTYSYPPVPLHESSVLLKILRIFHKGSRYFTARFKLFFMISGLACHWTLFRSQFRASRTSRIYVLSIISSMALNFLLWKPFFGEYNVLSLIKQFNRFLWPLSSRVVGAVNMFLIRLSGVECVMETVPGGPILNTGVFSAKIAYPCSGFESLSLFASVMLIVLFTERKRISVKRWSIVLAGGLATVYLANIFRIFTLFLVGHYVSGDLAMGAFHTHYGYVIYTAVICLILLFTYKWMIKKKEK